MPATDIVEITELEEFSPTRVDGVGKAANGFPILMLKGLDDEDRPPCDKCDGVAKAEGPKCQKCLGTGKMPRVGDTVKATAPSSAEVAPPGDCPTCNGGGNIPDGTANGKACPDCGGTGKDGTAPTDDALSRVDGFAGSQNNGDGRLTIDKAVDEDVAKDDSGVDVTGDGTDDGDDADEDTAPDASNTPGSPEWEADDAEVATQAARHLMEASALIAQFKQREGMEVAAGDGNDLFDEMDIQNALDRVTVALSIIARLAFHEGMEAQKEVAVKSGKRLSTKSVSILTAARDHITALLGDDDPAKSNDDEANKSREDVLDMTADELNKLLDERDARLAKEAEEASTDADADAADASDEATTADADAATEDAEKAKKKPPVEDGADADAEDGAEDGADGDEDDADAAKADAVELTPEEIEANAEIDRLRKQLKEAEEAQKQAADNATLSAKIEEHLAKVVEQNEILKATVEGLQSDLESVKKMAAPGGPVKTVPQAAKTIAAERDVLEGEIAKYERLAKETSERELREGYNAQARQLRAKLAETK